MTKILNNRGRNSVSAEAYGIYHKKIDFKATKSIKTNEQVERIKQRISQSFLFSELDYKDLDTVINAFEEKIYR